MKKFFVISSIAIIILGCTALLSSCNEKSYKVDYNGQKSTYENAKDSYKAGEKVEFYFTFVATDTDYSFYLDEKKLNPLYEEGKGYVIKFTMPDHDVSVKWESTNSMLYQP